MNIIDEDESSEGVWVLITRKDFKDYEEDFIDRDDMFRVGVLCNQSLCGAPYGMLIPFQLQGLSRPVCRMSKIDPDIRSCKVEVPVAKNFTKERMVTSETN